MLWNPGNCDHKVRNCLNDAWDRIAASMPPFTVSQLKNKKESLLSTFRPLCQKLKNSLKSGAGADEVFRPGWFAFKHMEFLKDIYEPRSTYNTDRNVSFRA